MRSDPGVTEPVENLILEYLRAMCADIGAIRQALRDVKLRIASLENHVASVLGDVLRQNTRIDELDERIGRIEHRLELQP